MNCKKIQQALPNLEAKELKSIRDKIDFLLKDNKVSDKRLEEFLYDAVISSVERILKNKSVPFHVFTGNKMQKVKLMQTVKYLQDYAFKIIGARTVRIEYQKVCLLFAKLMVHDLQGHPAALSTMLVLNCHEQFPSILDKNFPGYISSGLIKKLL